jgi:LacI family transcriptional regulator
MNTMGDVARLAKVSVATVSAVINGNKKVSPKLQERVQKAIRALDYHPDQIARSLRVRRTFTVGVMVPNVASMFFSEVFRGIEEVSRYHGYSAILCVSDDDAAQERHQLSLLVARRVDGILLASADVHAASHWPRGRDTPLVLIDRVPPALIAPAVVINNAKAAYEATKHLLSLGHRRIAIITGPPDRSTAFERMEGFRRAMQEAGCPMRQEYIRNGEFRLQGGYQCALQLLKLPVPPTAIFSSNYDMTLGMMRAVIELRVPCPEKVSLLSFDDFVMGDDKFSWAKMFSPALTTVAQPSYEIGKIAMGLLLRAIEPKKKPPYPDGNLVRLEAELRVRESTAAPAADAAPEEDARRSEVNSPVGNLTLQAVPLDYTLPQVGSQGTTKPGDKDLGTSRKQS